MNLTDVFTFITKTYNSKLSESLLIWLSSFNYYDRVLFVNFFVLNQLKFYWRGYKNFNDNYKIYHKTNCKCKLIFDTYVKDLVCDKIDDVWFLKKCCDDDEKNSDVINIDLITKKDMVEHHNLNINFIKPDEYTNNSFNFDMDVDTFTSKINDSKELTLKELNNKKIIKLNEYIDKINICEFYVLIYPFMPTIRMFDGLLPEYLRMGNMRNRNRNIQNLTAESILMNIYNFFHKQNLQQIDTNMKLTHILPNISYINIPISDVNNEYFYQPRISGLRLFICKSLQSKLIIMNKNHIKIKINQSILKNIKLDNINSYSGEFMLVLYNNETEQFHAKRDLLNYLKNPNPIYSVKLILLDLYIWQSINLLIDSYEKRYELFDSFINYVYHKNTILKIQNYNNISDIYEPFKRYLDTTALNSFIDGIVYKKKNTVFQTHVQVINFNYQFQKHIIIYKYKTEIKILHNTNKSEVLNGNFIVISSNNTHRNKVFCVCYDVQDNILKTALFHKNVYKPFCNIVTDFNVVDYKKCLNSKYIKINGETYSWFILRLDFSDDYRTLNNIEYCPNKTLFDCTLNWFSL